jgi:hypothetical protein
VKLLDSHLIPAALYKIVRDERFKVAHPVHISTDVTVPSPRQVSDYLLCADCERRFEQGGETWVIRRCWQNTTTFPLRASLVNAQPIPTMEAGVAIYQGARVLDVDVDRLTYFAASVFWRAAAHQWSIHKQTLPQLKLGPYEEQLRQYLLGGSFPAAAVLAVFIGYGMEEMRNAVVTFPYLSGRDKGWRRYTFTIPGNDVLAFRRPRHSEGNPTFVLRPVPAKIPLLERRNRQGEHADDHCWLCPFASCRGTWTETSYRRGRGPIAVVSGGSDEVRAARSFANPNSQRPAQAVAQSCNRSGSRPLNVAKPLSSIQARLTNSE